MSSGVTAKVLFEYIAEQDDELTIRMGDIITNVDQEEGGWWKGEVNGKSGMFPENFVSIVKSQSSTFKAEVKFDYDPTQQDEIALVKGTIIEVTDTSDEGWWKGRYNGNEGLFPSNFVVTGESSKSSEPTDKDAGGEPMKQPEHDAKMSHPQKQSKIANLLGMKKPEDMMRTTNMKKKVPVGGGAEQKPDELVPEASNEALKPTQLVQPMHVDDEKEKNKKLPVMATATGSTRESKPIQYAVALYDYTPELKDELELKIGDKIIVIESELTFEGWMKGEVNGIIGIFPDNFVELVPMDNTERHIPESTREEPVQKPQLGMSMHPPASKLLQNELAKKLAQKPSLNSSPPTTRSKLASKAPPPPVPGGKPSLLPGTKPKPQIPHSKPVKPPLHMGRSDRPSLPHDTKPHLPHQPTPKDDAKPVSLKPELNLPANILKPVLPKSEGKPSIDNTNDVQTGVPMNIPENNRSLPVDELKSETEGIKDVAHAIPKCASTSSIKKPRELESLLQRSHTLSGSDAESLDIMRHSKTDSNKEINKDDLETTDVHRKLTEKPSLQLDDVKPTDPLKHIQRAKPPSKSPPAKYKDKDPLDETTNHDDDNTKEVNELKSQVANLHKNMVDLEERFKKLATQLIDDLSNERILRAKQEVEIDTLKKKLDVLLPNLDIIKS